MVPPQLHVGMGVNIPVVGALPVLDNQEVENFLEEEDNYHWEGNLLVVLGHTLAEVGRAVVLDPCRVDQRVGVRQIEKGGNHHHLDWRHHHYFSQTLMI